MTTPPENSGSSAPRVVTISLLVLAIGAGAYFLGRRNPPATAPSTASAQSMTAPIPANPASPDRSAAPAATSSVASGQEGGNHRFAPRDTFFLLQYVSVKTPTGVTGFEPGQEVHLVEVHRPTQTLVVTDGQAQVEVGPDKLTNDLDVADMVRQKDQANQAKIAAYVEKEQKAYDDYKKDAAIKASQALDKIDQENQQKQAAVAANTARQGTPTGGTTGSKLDEPAVPVGGTSGYGYGGSSYGSPYSYFGGSTASGTATAPAATGGGAAGGRGTSNPATVGH